MVKVIIEKDGVLERELSGDFAALTVASDLGGKYGANEILIGRVRTSDVPKILADAIAAMLCSAYEKRTSKEKIEAMIRFQGLFKGATMDVVLKERENLEGELTPGAKVALDIVSLMREMVKGDTDGGEH